MQAELLLRCEELRDELWDMCDTKMEENEAEVKRIMSDSFTPDQLNASQQQLTALAQLELDRFAATATFMRNAAAFRMGIFEIVEQPFLPASEDVFKPPSAQYKDMLEGKAAVPMPDYVNALSEKSPQLATAFKIAICVVSAMEKAVDPAGADPKLAAAATKRPGAVELTPAQAETLRSQVAEAIVAEAAITKRRLQQMAENAASYLQDVSEAQEHVGEVVNEWVKNRYAAECSAVSATEAIIKKAAHDKMPLPYDLRLEVRAAEHS